MNIASSKLPSHWKAARQDYQAVHQWMYRHYGKASRCEICHSDKYARYHWANISGDYKRDITDWKQLCPSCHGKLDMTQAIRERMSKSRRGITPKCVKLHPVSQYSTTDEFIKYFPSISCAARELGLRPQTIHNFLMGYSRNGGGFKWE